MTNSSSKDKPIEGPHERVVEIIKAFEPLCVAMIKDMNSEERNVAPERLAELMNVVGELVWMAGSIEVCNNIASAEKGGLIKVVH